MMKKTIIFDIGGVLFELDFKNSISKLLNSNEKDFEKLFQQWLLSKTVRKFEAGKIDFDTFYKDLSEEFSLSLDKESFTKEFESVIVGDFNGTGELLQELHEKGYTLYALSNITAFHWDMLLKEYDFMKYITKGFLSYEIGSAKPDDLIFQTAIKTINTEANEILYFDDNKLNVEGALKNGLNAYHTIGLDKVKEILKELKIINSIFLKLTGYHHYHYPCCHRFCYHKEVN